MRIRLLLIILFVGFTCLAGCRSRRQSATTSLIKESVSPNSYWRHVDDCDSCGEESDDLNVEGVPANSEPHAHNPGKLFVGNKPARLHNSETSSRIVPPKNRLTCKSCDQKKAVLVDGNCMDCIKERFGDKKISEITNAENLPESLRNELSGMNNKLPEKNSSRSTLGQQSPIPSNLPSLKNGIPSPAKIDEIVGQSIQPEPLPQKQDAEPLAGSVDASPAKANTTESKNDLEENYSAQPIQPEQGGETNGSRPFESKLNDFIPTGTKKSGGTMQSVLDSFQNGDFIGKGKDVTALNKTDAVEEPKKETMLPKVSESSIVSKQDIEPVEESKPTSSRITTGISGGVELQPNPTFETFSLEDLFIDENELYGDAKSNSRSPEKSNDNIEWGPPIKDSQEPKTKARRDDEQGEVDPIHQPPTSSRKPRVSMRSEEEVFRDLQNATLANRVIFDNTPPIAEELVKPEVNEFVLRARPVEFYHDVMRLADANRKREMPVAATEKISRSRVPVLQAKTQVIKQPNFEFNPLPVINQPNADELGLGTDSVINDEVFDSYDFPEANSTKDLRLENDDSRELESNPSVDPSSDTLEENSQTLDSPGEIPQEPVAESELFDPDVLASLSPVEYSDPRSAAADLLFDLSGPERKLTMPQASPVAVDQHYVAELEEAIYETELLFNQWSLEIPEVEILEDPAADAFVLRPMEAADSEFEAISNQMDGGLNTSAQSVSHEVSAEKHLETVTELPVLPNVQSANDQAKDFLLQAIPESAANDQLIEELQIHATSKAQFRFIQPHYQRVVEDK